MSGAHSDGLHGEGLTLDRETLSNVYDEYHRPIYSYIYRQVDEVETARDLTAEVFRRLLQSVRNGAGPDQDIKAWLFRSAHNLVIDFYRSRRFRNHAPLNHDSIGFGEDPAAIAERNVQAGEVIEAWQNLTPDQRQVIELKFMQEFSNEEAAQVMQKPVTAVKTLQHRALAALRRQLEKSKERVTS